MVPTRDLCIMACAFCRCHDFLEYLQEIDPKHDPWTEDGAKEFILVVCGVGSRSELDRNAGAAASFHNLVRRPFMDWRAQQKSK